MAMVLEVAGDPAIGFGIFTGTVRQSRRERKRRNWRSPRGMGGAPRNRSVDYSYNCEDRRCSSRTQSERSATFEKGVIIA